MSRKMKLDFTGVESFQRASEGEHACKIVTADEKVSSGGNDMIVVAFEVIRGEDKTARVYENYPLVETALWKLKGLLQAIGMKADGKVQLDLDKLIGKTLTVNVKHEEYDGKIRARVESVKKLVGAASDDDEESDDDEDDEEEEKPVKNKATEKKEAPAKKSAKADEDDDDDDWGDDDDDEDADEPMPKPKNSGKPDKGKAPEKKPEKPAKKPSKKDDDDDDDWDDDDWDE